MLLSVTVAASGIYYYILRDFNFFKERFKKHGIPYKTPFPILGNMVGMILYRESIADFLNNIYKLHPEAKYVGMFDMTNPVIVIRDPELIKSIAQKNFDLFSNHRSFIEDPLFGKNLFALKGERWRQVQPLLSSAFTSSKMKDMFILMSDCAVKFSNYLMQMPAEKRVMEIHEAFTRYTNNVIATCAFGLSFDSMRNPNNEFYAYGREATTFDNLSIIKFYIFRSLPWLAKIFKFRMVRQKVADFFQDLVETTIKTRDENGTVRPDMLQLIMESRDKEGKPELSIEDMVSQAFIFFFGGFETTSTLMCFVAHELAVNQDIQRKLQNEVDQGLEESYGKAPYEIINNMEYLDAVVNETLRKYPVNSGLERVCVKDFILPPALPGRKSFTIEKGESIWIPVYGLQHNPQYFKDPKKFDPERFIGERKKESFNCGAYLPFGLGPRMCIGNRFALMETKVLLFHLLARCDLKTCVKTRLPLKIAKDGFNLKPEGGFWLNVSPRKNVHHSTTKARWNTSAMK